MNAHDFTIWLRGFLDAVGGVPTAAQMNTITQALKSVAPTTVVNPAPLFAPAGARDPFKMYGGPRYDGSL